MVNPTYIEALNQSAKDLENVYFVGTYYGKWDFTIG
jgi:hypothetical protein